MKLYTVRLQFECPDDVRVEVDATTDGTEAYVTFASFSQDSLADIFVQLLDQARNEEVYVEEVGQSGMLVSAEKKAKREVGR